MDLHNHVTGKHPEDIEAVMAFGEIGCCHSIVICHRHKKRNTYNSGVSLVTLNVQMSNSFIEDCKKIIALKEKKINLNMVELPGSYIKHP